MGPTKKNAGDANANGAPRPQGATAGTASAVATTTVDDLRDASWAVAEELLHAGYHTEGALVLDSLIARFATLAARPDAADDLATRVRAADLLLATTSSADAPRRILDAGSSAAELHTVPAVLRSRYFRMCGIAARRRQRFTDALRSFQRAKVLAQEANAMTTSGGGDSSVPSIELEIARVHFARCVDAGFADVPALETLRGATSSAAASVLSGVSAATPESCSLVVCHALACAVLGEADAAQRLLRAAAAAVSPAASAMAPQFALLEWLIGAAAALPANGASASGGSPLPSEATIASLDIPDSSTTPTTSPTAPGGSSLKLHRIEGAAEAAVPLMASDSDSSLGGTSLWLSKGACTTLLLLHRLLAAASAGKHAEANDTFRQLSKAADGALRAINSASAARSMTPGANAELRLLVGLKLSAFFELALSDLTTGQFTEAAGKLDSLAAFMLVFVRHTVHFVPLFHAAAAVLCVATQQFDAAERHVAVLAQSPFGTPAETKSLAFLLGLYISWASNRRETFSDTIDAFRLGGGSCGLTADVVAATARSPRLALLSEFFVGLRQLSERDWRSAASTLKKVASGARDAYGVASPIVSAALRLLAEAHTQAGNVAGSEAAATMATQIAQSSGDVVSAAQCVAWAISRMPQSLTEQESSRRQALYSSHQKHAARYATAAAAAVDCPAMKRVVGFLPDSDSEYQAWLQRVGAAAAGGGASSTSPSAGGGGGPRASGRPAAHVV
jgi:tetratricopeptide (TPR) repeat protein